MIITRRVAIAGLASAIAAPAIALEYERQAVGALPELVPGPKENATVLWVQPIYTSAGSRQMYRETLRLDDGRTVYVTIVGRPDMIGERIYWWPND